MNKDLILQKTIGEYGIFLFTVLDTFNVVNLKTHEIMPILNLSSIDEAEEYINSLLKGEM